MKHILILENLNCAHCAGKIEEAIANTEGYENVSFSFSTKKLIVFADKDDITADIQAICDSIEDGVFVKSTSQGTSLKKHTLILENLNCAHCAGKIEEAIANTDGYENVSFSFSTKKLIVFADKADITADIQAICDSIEDGVLVKSLIESEQKPDKKASRILDLVLLIVSIVIGAGCFALELSGMDNILWVKITMFILSGCAAIMSGRKTFIKGIKNILKLRFDENALMTIAVVAAFCLGECVEGAMVTILFAIGEILEDKAVDSSRRDIEKLAKIRPDNATILIDGTEKTVNAENVEIGSIVVVKPYERVPLDGIIIKGSTTLDTSALTGESVPVDANEGSEALSGAVNGSNLIHIKTTKRFGDSTATRILKLVEEAAAQKGSGEKLISRFASVYTPIVIAISLIIAILPPLLGLGAFSEWIYRALVCLVASCPCAIVISVPLAYYSGIGAASKLGMLIKGGRYLEALAKADTFVFDKTGTLTSGKLSVGKVMSLSSYSEDELISLAAACEKYSSHPIALAIKEKAEGKALPELSDYSETAGHGTSAVYNGKKLMCVGSKALSNEQKSSAPKEASVYILEDNRLIGAICVSDTIRPEAQKVISDLRKLGVSNAVMLTGDNTENAKAVSAQAGLTDYRAELLPDDKLSAVTELKKNTKAVCFVGDGINDAPVLSASDCGIAMGLGSEAAIEASDAVLASGNLSPLAKAVKLARRVMATVRFNIAFALTIKAAVIVLAALGLASMWMSVLADTGVSVICVLIAASLLKRSK